MFWKGYAGGLVVYDGGLFGYRPPRFGLVLRFGVLPMMGGSQLRMLGGWGFRAFGYLACRRCAKVRLVKGTALMGCFNLRV